MPIFLAKNTPILAIGNSGPGTVPSHLNPDSITLASGHEKWDDLRLAGTDLRGGVSAPSFLNYRNGLYLQGFVYNQVDEVHFAIQLPHCWKEGSDLHPHLHWTHNVASPGNDAGVVWKLEYSWTNIDGTFPATSTMTAALTWTTSPPVQYKHILTEFLDGEGEDHIVGLGKKVSSQLIGRLYRDTTEDLDNWGQTAFLVELDFHYQIDSLGSDQEFIK